MKINYPLIEALFIDRPNRFLCRVDLNGLIVNTHLPDPGRLKEILMPGSKVLIKKEFGKNRKTAYSTQAIYKNGVLISLNTLIPNKFVSHLILGKKIPFLKNWVIKKAEVQYGNHRFDFQLQKGNEQLILEVKSVNFVENSISMFPDAITLRGKSHVISLGEMAKRGDKTMILFVVQRPDSILFKPKWDIDPKFCDALCRAWEAGMIIKVIHLSMNKDCFRYKGEIPYKLNSSL